MTPKKQEIKAPKHLLAPTRRWFERTAAEYVLEPHHLKLLEAAGEAWDQKTLAREQVATEGMTTIDRFGQTKPHPAVQIEHVSALRFAKLLRELNLDEPPNESRPPRIGGAKW